MTHVGYMEEVTNHTGSSKTQWEEVLLPRWSTNRRAALSPPMPTSCWWSCTQGVLHQGPGRAQVLVLSTQHALCSLLLTGGFSLGKQATPPSQMLRFGEGGWRLVPAPIPGWPCDPGPSEAHGLVLAGACDPIETTGAPPGLWLALSSS